MHFSGAVSGNLQNSKGDKEMIFEDNVSPSMPNPVVFTRMVSEWILSFDALLDAIFVAVLDATVPLAALLAAIFWSLVKGLALLAWLGLGPVHSCFQTPSCGLLAAMGWCDILMRVRSSLWVSGFLGKLELRWKQQTVQDRKEAAAAMESEAASLVAAVFPFASVFECATTIAGALEMSLCVQAACAASAVPNALWLAFVTLVDAGSSSTDPWAGWRPTMLRSVHRGSESGSLFEWVDIELQMERGCKGGARREDWMGTSPLWVGGF